MVVLIEQFLYFFEDEIRSVTVLLWAIFHKVIMIRPWCYLAKRSHHVFHFIDPANDRVDTWTFPPMSQYDAAAMPLWHCFSETPDDLFNRVIWFAVKGTAPYPPPKRSAFLKIDEDKE